MCPLRGTRAQASSDAIHRHQTSSIKIEKPAGEASGSRPAGGILSSTTWRNAIGGQSWQGTNTAPARRAERASSPANSISAVPCKSRPVSRGTGILTPYVKRSPIRPRRRITAAVIRPCRQGIRHAHCGHRIDGRGGHGRSRRHVGQVLAEEFTRGVPDILVKLGEPEKTRPQERAGFYCGGPANRPSTKSPHSCGNGGSGGIG